jgi:hypothetical protein
MNVRAPGTSSGTLNPTASRSLVTVSHVSDAPRVHHVIVSEK